MNNHARLCVASAVAFVLITAAFPAIAQDTIEATPTAGDSKNAVAIGASFDPALTFDASYARRLPLALGDTQRDLTTSFTVSTIPGFTNWDVESTAAIRIWQRRGFDLLTQGGLTLKQISNSVHRGVGYGYQLGLFPGYFGKRWHVTGEFSVRHIFAMSVSHTDAYRDVFPDARDGTYALGGLNTFVGLTAGMQLGNHATVGLRAAWRFQNVFQAFLPYYQPATGSLQLGYRF